MTLLDTIEQARQSLETVQEDKRIPLIHSIVSLTKRLLSHVMSFRDIPDNFEKQLYPAITNQIHAAEKRTEKAANDIMTLTENILSATGRLKGADTKDIQVNVNKLFEACSFQDLVAQHLNEIKLLMDRLQADMSDLKGCIDELGSEGDAGVARKERATRSDAHLLNGPATNF